MITSKEYMSASRYVVKNSPDWATPATSKYAQLYLEHGTVVAVAQEVKKTPQSVGSSLAGLVKKYRRYVKGTAPPPEPLNAVKRDRVVIRPAKTKLLSDLIEVMSWAENMSDAKSGDVVLASTPLGELVWRAKK